MPQLEQPTGKPALRHPFSIECHRVDKQFLLSLCFKTDGSAEQCAASLKAILAVLDDVSAAESFLGYDAHLKDALHFSGSESQYTVGVEGEDSLVTSLFRRFLRAPPVSERLKFKATCALSPIGDVHRRRLQFAGSDKDAPLATLVNAPNLADLLALRLSKPWPLSHGGDECRARALGG